MTETYILNTDNFNFEPYSDKGFSGNILLAVPKSADFPKLLIKSDNPSSACTEFMYSRLAELLRIPTPKAYLMNVAKKDRRRFGSPYVVGLEYLDGLHRFDKDEMRSSPTLKREYAGQFALSAMFEQDDLLQMAMTADGHIVSFDFSEAFWLSDISTLTYLQAEKQLTYLLTKRLQASARRQTSMLSAAASVVKEHFGLPKDAPVPCEYLDPLRAMYALTEDDIEELLDTLDQLYSTMVSAYFEEYLIQLQKKIAAYFEAIGEKL